MFLSGNANISVGTSSQVSLNRDELATIAAEIGDGYFGDKRFWGKVIISFQISDEIYEEGQLIVTDMFQNHDVSRQQITVSFGEDSDLASLVASATAIKGIWSINEVILFDKDHGSLTIKKSQIPNSPNYDLVIQ